MKKEKEVLEDEQPETDELYERLVLTIDKGQEPLRIDKFLMSRIEGATRNKIQQGIDNEMVLVNEKPVKNNYKVRGYDKIVVFDSHEPGGSDIIPENMPLCGVPKPIDSVKRPKVLVVGLWFSTYTAGPFTEPSSMLNLTCTA